MPLGRAFAHFNLHCCLGTMALRINRPVSSTVVGDWDSAMGSERSPAWTPWGWEQACTLLFGHGLHKSRLILRKLTQHAATRRKHLQIIVPFSTVNLERKGFHGIVLKILFAALTALYDSNSKLIA